MYNILKSYDSKPSKNGFDQKNLTHVQAMQELQNIAKSWKKYGGLVVEQSNELLIVQEADASETITFSIQEADE